MWSGDISASNCQGWTKCSQVQICVHLFGGITVGVCILMSALRSFAIGSSGENHCYQLCTNTLSTSTSAQIAASLSLIFFIWIPSSVVIGFCYMWIFVLYKSRSLRTGTNLTCKMLSLPGLMPFTVFILKAPATALAFVIIFVGQSLLPAYATILAMNVLTIYLDVSGLVYPLLLLFLNHYIRNDWKTMLMLLHGTAFNWLKFIFCKCCPCKKHTQVAPAPAPETTQATLSTFITLSHSKIQNTHSTCMPIVVNFAMLHVQYNVYIAFSIRCSVHVFQSTALDSLRIKFIRLTSC